MSRVGAAFANAVREMRSAIPDKADPLRTYLRFLIPAACLIGGFMFAAQGIGGAGFVLNSLSGCVATFIYMMMTIGGFAAFLFAASFLLHLKHGPQPRKPGTFGLIDKILLGASGLIIGIVLFGVLTAVSFVPILGKQVTFMFRDRD
ncbi:hypothetical protein [Methylobacterium symbioticum]|uniref:Uncharacterized protein n=1 Tax=Methylobacterium symbioticum TaxID=2584084 RepID=A0A509E732_9HYPH|nr:hypothetical protein [Methylobacterium symbioticum]VUD70037.1 hypothetical protein MET9862_00598 [Methylobacterium symbioticum]